MDGRNTEHETRDHIIYLYWIVLVNWDQTSQAPAQGCLPSAHFEHLVLTVWRPLAAPEPKGCELFGNSYRGSFPLIGGLILIVRKVAHPLKASKAPNPPQARPLQLSKANTAYMACFRWLLYTAPQSSLLRPRKLFLLAFETATWHVRHPLKASKAQNLRSF